MNIRRPIVVLLFAAVAATTVLAQAPKPWREHAPEVRGILQRAEDRPLASLAFARTEPDTSGVDVTKYTIWYDVDFGAKRIDARTRVDAVATRLGVTSVALDFVGFHISSVTVDGAPAASTRTNGGRVLSVELPHALALGDSVSIEVAFDGQPTIEDGLGFGFTKSGAASFAEPEGARLWYPCKDRPSDKAQYEGFITVPSEDVVASNGRLVGVTDATAGRHTYHWQETHQIATYLIDVAISPYHVIEDSLGDLPIQHYVYPTLTNAATRDFSRTPEMVATFQERLGVPYPFDKYGHALFENFGGAMEHQSCTSYGAGLITGDNRYDYIVAHELGHQWFGDFVSPAEWEEIWLNEGFATWTEFVWVEHSDPGFLPTYLAGSEASYIDYEERAGAYSLYAPAQLFGTTVYDKGGWVVAMLRSLIGDEAFFAGMKSYLEAHAYGNARTTDFESAMEQASGRDLSDFFAQWVYGTGYPRYETAWTSRAVPGGHWQVDLRVRQTQSTPTVFTYPLEVEAVDGHGGSVRSTLDVTSADVLTSLCFDFQPTRVTVDPDNRVLGPVFATGDVVPAQPAVCAEGTPTLEIASVELGKNGLRVTGSGFVVGDAVVEVGGTALDRTKYPRRFRNADGTTTVLLGKQKRLRELFPAGTPVQVTVLSTSTGVRSAPFAFTR